MTTEPTNHKLHDIERLASLGELIAGIAHELNNPLTAIVGYAEILQSIDFDPQVRRYISNVHIAALRSAKIVDGLLTFLRRKEIELENASINEVIRQTVSLFEYQMRSSGVSLMLNLASGLPKVNGNSYKLQQVFFNLIMNALQAFEGWTGERRISISSSREGSTVKVSVADSGPGIDQALVEKVFNPFFTTKQKGTGLGLSIVHGIVREHGGGVSIMPSAGGCLFAIELPEAGRHSSGDLKEERPGQETVSIYKRVLIVDDDELVVEFFSTVMELMGCDVTFATCPADALAELQRSDYDMVFVDYRMPLMNGVDFIEKASQFMDVKKFVIISGDITLDTEVIQQRCDVPVLRKPITSEELKNVFLRYN